MHFDFTSSFDSFGEFLELISQRPSMPLSRFAHGTFASVDHKWDEFGGASFRKAIELAGEGWPEGLEKVEDITAELRQDIAHADRRYSVRYDVTGHTPDVGRFLQGEPECMMNDEFDPNAGTRIVRMGVSISYSAGISHAVIERRGAGICAMIDALEAAGVRVELTINSVITGAPRNYRLDIVLKQSGEPLDRELVAYALMHPSMFRRLAFSWMEIVSKDVPTALCNTYGFPEDPVDADSEFDIWFGEARTTDPRFRTVEDTVATINATVGKYLTRED